MTSPIIALRAAARTFLAKDATLATMLGNKAIFDEAPRAATPPYATFGDYHLKDWSTASDTGFEIFWSIEVWSNQTSALEALTIAEQIRTLLHAPALVVGGYNFIAITLETSYLRRADNARLICAGTDWRTTLELQG